MNYISFPLAHVQAHFMPSGMRLAQEYLDDCFCMKRTIRKPTIGPRPTRSGTLGKSEPCVQREPTGRVLFLIVIENRKKEPTRDRKTNQGRRERQTERQWARDASHSHLTRNINTRTHHTLISHCHCQSEEREKSERHLR